MAVVLFASILLPWSSIKSEPLSEKAITFTYNLLTGSCTASTGTCNNLSTHAICSTNLSVAQIAQNDAALHSFNAEAQRHTRPAEPGYAGGNDIRGGVSLWRGAGDPYPDANINNNIVLQIPACNKLQYTWNSFTMLVRNIKVVGAGSSSTFLQNVNVQYFHNDVAGRSNYDFFGDTFYGILDNTYPTDAYGYLINTANAGAAQVTLKSAADVGNFYVGRWVLVMSYIQDSMGSYPPNMRYYDFAKVTGINFSTGVIDLDTPLAFDHLSTRPYDGRLLHAEPSIAGNGIGAGIVGPARIVNIDTPVKPVAENFELDGIHFLRNPRSSLVTEYNDGWEFTGAIDARGDDLVFDGALDTAEMRNFTLTNSSAIYEEADKIIANATYINNTFINSLLHSGQLVWHATGGAYGGEGLGELSCAALNCIIDGGAVLTAAQLSSGPHPDMELDRVGLTNSLSFDGVTFRGNGSRGSAAINAWQGFPYRIGSAGIALQSGPNGLNTRLAISKCVWNPVACTDMENNGTMAQDVTSNWGEGSTLTRNGTLVPGATITAITGDAGNIYVDVKSATFAIGESVYFSRVNSVSVTNSTFIGIGNDCHPSSGPDGCIRYPGNENIPSVTWSHNTGG
jgi:hypothetical protein